MKHVLTEVSAEVAENRVAALIDGFAALVDGPVPDGLLRTELLRAADGRWRIQSLWRDRAALDAMREGTAEPAAPRLFRSVGSEPVLQVLLVEAGYTPADAP